MMVDWGADDTELVWQARLARAERQLTEAAAFLDGLAVKADAWLAKEGHPIPGGQFEEAAAGCRAMAAKLRGET
jgi:hypothetical protein